MKYILIFTVLVASYLVLDDLHKTEQQAVYKQCLVDNDHNSLVVRYKRVESRWTKQAIQHKSTMLKSKCNNLAKEHFSI